MKENDEKYLFNSIFYGGQLLLSFNFTCPKIKEYQSLLYEKFKNSVERVYHKNKNEIHVVVSNSESSSLVVYFLYDELKCRLATVICNDERKIGGSYVGNDDYNYIGGGFILRYVFSKEGEDIFFIITSKLSDLNSLAYPSIVSKIPSAAYYEREMYDMFGVLAEGNPDTRKLILHEQWPDKLYPLRKDFDIKTKVEKRSNGNYPFLKVEGEGICEIPVGPVHAGIIEPGHFRFSIYGENIINLETRLYYTHKGVEKLAETMNLDEALLLSERIAGDESVANSMAYCQAIEKMASIQIPKKADQIRTLCAELERIWNHLGTIAGLSTDVGFAYGASRMNILKEKMMRLNEKISGSRLLFGINRVGGVKIDIKRDTLQLILNENKCILHDFDSLVKLLQTTSSFMNRLTSTGIISRKAVVDLGANGVIARCIGVDVDTRKDHPYAYYTNLDLDAFRNSAYKKMEYEVELNKRKGDALSRFDIRVKEIRNSINIIQKILTNIQDNNCKDDGNNDEPNSLFINNLKNYLKPYDNALGYTESHRGQTLHWVMLGEDTNHIFRYKVRTASFCNWPLIEQAVQNNIVPDFPLINKSFDLSYSGNDL